MLTQIDIIDCLVSQLAQFSLVPRPAKKGRGEATAKLRSGNKTERESYFLLTFSVLFD